MKVIAVNGSPRKGGNTAEMLRKALEGASSSGASTELVHLYDLNFKGCTSCFACKLKDGRSYGRCAWRDDLTAVLDRVPGADALLFGSPIYFGNVSGEMRSFLERLLFPYLVYDESHNSLFPRKIRVGWIYTMNAPEEYIPQSDYGQLFKRNEQLAAYILGPSETVVATDTWQFNDYSKYVSSMFDPEHKARRRKEGFPRELHQAYEMGQRLGAAKPG